MSLFSSNQYNVIDYFDLGEGLKSYDVPVFFDIVEFPDTVNYIFLN